MTKCPFLIEYHWYVVNSWMRSWWDSKSSEFSDSPLAIQLESSIKGISHHAALLFLHLQKGYNCDCVPGYHLVSLLFVAEMTAAVRSLPEKPAFSICVRQSEAQIQESVPCGTDFLWDPREAVWTIFLSSSSCKMELITTDNVFHKANVRIEVVTAPRR